MSKRFTKAKEAVKRRNYDYAIELFLQELLLNPNNGDARRALRAAELKKFQEAGLPTSGGAAYAKGLSPLMRAYLCKLTKKWERCMLACEEFLKLAPEDPRVMALLGFAARQAGHEEAAMAAFEELREIDRGSAVALRNLGQLYQEVGDFNRALAYYEQLRRVVPSDPEASKAVRDLAASGASRKVEERTAGGGDFRELVRNREQADKAEKGSRRIRTAGDADAVIESLRAKLDGTAADAVVWQQIAEAQIKKKDLESALASYAKSIEAKSDPLVEDALGDLRLRILEDRINKFVAAAKGGDAGAAGRAKALRKERIALGIEEYARRVKHRPTELELRFKLGTALYKAKRFDDALVELQKAVKDPRRGGQGRLLLGKCFAAKKLVDLAAKEFERARQTARGMDTLGKEATYSLAVLYEANGKAKLAASEFEKIVEVDIGYRDVMQRLEALQTA